MEVLNSAENEITLTGNIKSLKDYQDIKTAMLDLISKGADHITVKTPQSFSMTSSVIGFFMKVIYQDKVRITLYVTDMRLYDLLKDLKLIDTFNVILTDRFD